MRALVDPLKEYLIVGDFDVFEDVLTLLYQLVIVVEVDMARLPQDCTMQVVLFINDVSKLNNRVIFNDSGCARERISVWNEFKFCFFFI